MNNNDKLALIDGSAKVQTQIEIKPLIVGETSLILREYDYISKWDMEDYKYVPNHGFIGQFVERILNVSLKNLPTDAKFENKELVLKLGVLTDAGVTWYSLGNFLIYEAKYDDVAGLWNLKGKDFCKKFNKKYEDTITYPCTALQLATNVCSQCGCSLATTNFKNKDFVINENQFVNGETCREVMKAIGMLAFTWVRIGWDNRVYLDFDKKTTVDPKNKITNDNYYNLKVTREVYGPVNRILIGLSNVTGENAYVEDAESIEKNGLCELDLYDNPLTYTEELRKLAIKNASGLLGLTYTPVELNTTGYPWLNGNELIEIVDMENGSLQTYAFDRRIEYFGHIKSSIKAQSISNVESTYKYNGSIKERIKRTEISVDKANGKISLVAETVDTIEKEITPTGQASGSNIHITDSADAELLDFKLYGKSTQETRSGRNLYNYKDTVRVAEGTIVDDDGWITLTYDNTSGTETKWTNYYTNNLNLKTNTQYAIFTEIKAVSGTGRLVPFGKNTPQTQGQFTSEKIYEFTDLSAGMVLINVATTLEDFTNIIYGLRTLASFSTGRSGSITFRISVLEDTTITADNFVYEAFGVMPSSSYPSEMKNVGYQNLFNGILQNGLWNINTKELGSTSSTIYKSFAIDLKKGTYTLSSVTSFSITRAFTDYDSSKNIIFTGNTASIKSFTFTLTENTKLYLSIRRNDNTTWLETDLLQLDKGSKAHPYIPFGKYGVEVETISKNIFNEEKLLNQESGYNTYNSTTGLWTTTSQSLYSKSILYNVAGSSSNRDINKLIKLKPNTTYYVKLFDFVNNTTNSTDALQYGLFDSNGVYISNIVRGLDTATFTTPADYDEVYLDIRRYSNSGTMSFSHIQISQDEFDEYEPYKLTQTLIQSDYPLMSNKDETIRDYLYLQNGNLYLKKNLKKAVYNGSEANWYLSRSDATNNKYVFRLTEVNERAVITDIGANYAISNYFPIQPTVTGASHALEKDYGISFYYNVTNLTGKSIYFIVKDIATLEDWLVWLAEHNVELIYPLAEPQDILIAENVDSLITYKNITNISTTDNLQPNMEVVYVKDNTLNDIYQTQNGMNKYYTKVENDALLEITDEKIESSVTEIESAMGTIEDDVKTLKSTYLSQTAEQFEMLFKETGIKEIVDSVDKLTKSNNATLVEQEQWIRFKGGNIELGRSDSQVKLLLSNDRISFMTGGNESAYISNNQLYITDSTILNKLQVGHWETIEEDGNLNTRWIEGVI